MPQLTESSDAAAGTGTAYTFTPGDTFLGAVDAREDQDWVRVALTPQQSYAFVLTRAPGDSGIALPVVRLYDGSARQLQQDSGPFGIPTVAVTPETAGIYYVSAAASSSFDTGGYVISAIGEARGDARTAERMAPNTTYESSLDYEDDEDWIAVTLTAGRGYGFTLTGGNGELDDPIVTLYDATGREIASDRFGGEGSDALLDYTASASGTYFLGVTANNGADIGDYALGVIEEVADTTATAAGVAANGSYRGRTDFAGDVDWVAVTLREGFSYGFELSGRGAGGIQGAVVGLYDANGAEIDVDGSSGSGTALLSYTPDADGRFYVSARAGGLFGNDLTGTYLIDLTREEADGPSTRAALSVGGSLRTAIDYAGDVDWIAVALVEGQDYAIRMAGNGGTSALTTPSLVLLDEDGFTVAQSESGGLSSTRQITLTPEETGLYYVRAGTTSFSSTGGYVVSVEGDRERGTGRADRLDGTAGPDGLYGLGGDDTIDGGAGADVIDGGPGTDTASFASATRSVRVDLQDDRFQFGDAVGDVYVDIEIFRTGDGADQLRGGADDDRFFTGGLSDRLYGRAGDDRLDGEGGADALYGGLGADTMTGGQGARTDRFIYFNVAETGLGAAARDFITDFAAGEDRIEISRFDADTTRGFKQGFDWIGTAAFSNDAGQLRYGREGGQTVIQADTDGDGRADFEIALRGAVTLDEGDFLL